MYCCIIWHFCSINDTKKLEKMQLKALRHIYRDYTSSYEMLSEKCNRPMLLIERQKAMLLEVYKCIYELGPRYRHAWAPAGGGQEGALAPPWKFKNMGAPLRIT